MPDLRLPPCTTVRTPIAAVPPSADATTRPTPSFPQSLETISFPPPSFLTNLPQRLLADFAILLSFINRLAVVPTRHHVIRRPFRFHPDLSRHTRACSRLLHPQSIPFLVRPDSDLPLYCQQHHAGRRLARDALDQAWQYRGQSHHERLERDRRLSLRNVRRELGRCAHH